MSELNSRNERINFYKKQFWLVLPMALQNLINVGVQAADVAMLGKIGEIAISSASLAGQVYFVMTLFFFGLTSGASVLAAQYWGKNDISTIEKIMGLTLRLGIIISIVFTAASIIFPEQIMHIFSNEEDVIINGAKYLRITAIAFIPSAITMLYLNVIRSVEKVIISTVVYGISVLVNIILNAIFIFGLLGSPRLEVVGAALATTIARYLELAIVIFYSIKINKTVKVRIKHLLYTSKILTKDFFHYALPVTANEVLWGLGISAGSAIIGHLGSAAVAANSITYVMRQLALVATFGVANATAIMTGKAIGENSMETAKLYTKRFLRLSIILGILGGLLVLSISPLVGKFVSLGEESRQYYRHMVIIMSIYIAMASPNTTLIVGVFRSGGDTKYGLYLDCLTLWCGSILLGAIAAFYFKWPVTLVYMFIQCDELLKIPFSFSRYKSLKWLKNVTRDNI